jgi:hypothetical protein
MIVFCACIGLVDGMRVGPCLMRLRGAGAGEPGIQKQLITAVEQGNLEDVLALLKVVSFAFILSSIFLFHVLSH